MHVHWLGKLDLCCRFGLVRDVCSPDYWNAFYNAEQAMCCISKFKLIAKKKRKGKNLNQFTNTSS